MTVKAGPPRLGRGLAALLGDPVPAASSGSPQTALIHKLSPSPFQPRRSLVPEELAELIASIKASGLLQPILVRPHPERDGEFQIIAGERRWRAAEAAGLQEVPVFVRTLSNSEVLAAALVENLQRQDLDPLEEAQALKRLLDDFGMTQESVAESIGKSRPYISNTVRLLQLPPAVQDAIQRGKLTAGHARALLTHPNPEAAAKTIIDQGLSVRQAEALAKDKATAPDRGSSIGTHNEYASLERELTERLGLKVSISKDAVRISYRTLDQLDGLVSLLGGA